MARVGGVFGLSMERVGFGGWASTAIQVRRGTRPRLKMKRIVETLTGLKTFKNKISFVAWATGVRMQQCWDSKPSNDDVTAGGFFTH